MVMDLNNLKPGLYLQRGDRIVPLKNLNLALEAWRSNEGAGYAPQDVETLAGWVTWVFVALERRKQRIAEIPYKWQVSGDDVEVAPIKFNIIDMLPRIDEALQLYKKAYLIKQKNLLGQFGGVRWADPTSITPDKKTADPVNGVTRYYRTVITPGGGYKREPIDASELIVFEIQGMRELGPGTPAGIATSIAAQILYGISQTADTVYDNNALPISLINVPKGTSPGDKKSIESRWDRLLNPKKKGTKGYRSIAVERDAKGEGISVENVSFKPSELAMDKLELQQRNAILAAHFVPQSEALSDASNMAVAEIDARRFTDTMGSRAKWCAEIVNQDPDVQSLDISITFYPEQHSSMAKSEVVMSEVFQRLLEGLTPEAAGYVAGIREEDFPDDMQERGIFLSTAKASVVPSVSTGVGNEPDQEGEDQDDDTEGEDQDDEQAVKYRYIDHLQKWERKALKAFNDNNLDRMVEFESEYIPLKTNDLIVEMLLTAKSPNDVRAIFDVAYSAKR